VLELPVNVMLPGRIRSQAQRAKRAPVVGGVAGKDLGAFVEVAGADVMIVVTTMPEVARLELFSLVAHFLLLALADLVGAVADELRVPLGQAKLPRHLGAAEVALPFVPTAIHRPVPRERHSVLDGEHRLDALIRPMLEPIGYFLDGREIDVE